MPLSAVTCHVVPAAEAYCTLHPVSADAGAAGIEQLDEVVLERRAGVAAAAVHLADDERGRSHPRRGPWRRRATWGAERSARRCTTGYAETTRSARRTRTGENRIRLCMGAFDASPHIVARQMIRPSRRRRAGEGAESTVRSAPYRVHPQRTRLGRVTIRAEGPWPAAATRWNFGPCRSPFDARFSPHGSPPAPPRSARSNRASRSRRRAQLPGALVTLTLSGLGTRDSVVAIDGHDGRRAAALRRCARRPARDRRGAGGLDQCRPGDGRRLARVGEADTLRAR